MHDHPLGADRTMTIEHVARVEGHGNIVVNIREGVVEEVRLEIVESPRFFESMLVGQDAPAAPELTSRICGICSVGHTTASIRAVETAYGIEPSAQTILLRQIMLHAEILQSHILHLYFLVAPDAFSAPSVIPLAEKNGEVVQRALRLKKFANRIMAVIGGRHIHPVSMKVGGFTRIPAEGELREILKAAPAADADIDETVKLFEGIRFPDFKRDTEYLALRQADRYSFYGGRIESSKLGPVDPDQYLSLIKESVVRHSTAKHAHFHHKPFAVGALARYNLNGRETLSPRARRAAAALDLEQMKDNPFGNNAAQVVECVHLLDEIADSVRSVISLGLKDEKPARVPETSGHGVGAVEVPRGTLYHEYEMDGLGHIAHANCVIPTGQNLARIEQDLREMVPQILDRPESEVRLQCEMLLRAYDPCISCSTHMLNVEFRK